MAHIVEDNVRESATTTGTGSFSLAGALNTGRTFSSALADADTCHYSIHHTTLNEWEVGLGTYETTGNLLLRTTPLESSNAGAAVNFSAGTKHASLVFPGVHARFVHDMAALTGVVRVDSGVPTADANVTDLVDAASDTVAGKIELAIQSEMETGTDVARAVTPGRQHFHASAAKCWAICANSTTLLASYNMTSFTDVGAGDGTFTIGTDFSSANWVPVVTQRHAIPSTTVAGYTINGAKAAGSVDMDTFDIEKAVGTAATRLDSSEIGFVGYGDLA